MNLHVYKAATQPATRFRVHVGDRSFTVKHADRARLPCSRCRRRRWGVNLIARAYYDGTWFTCKPGKGCKAAT